MLTIEIEPRLEHALTERREFHRKMDIYPSPFENESNHIREHLTITFSSNA